MPYVVRRMVAIPGYQVVHVDSGSRVEIIHQYLMHLSVRHYSMATLRSYSYALQSYWTWLESGERVMSDMSPSQFLEYLESLSLGPDGYHEPPAARTVNHRLAVLNSFHQWWRMTAQEPSTSDPTGPDPGLSRTHGQGLLGHIRRRSIRRPLRARVPHPLPEDLSVADVEIVIGHLRTVRDKAMALLMLNGGLRSMEVRTARLAYLDLGLQQIRVDGKGGRERLVPLDAITLKILHRYILTERPETTAAEIFVVAKGPHRGQPLTAAGFRTIFRYHSQQTGRPNVRPHRFRHTYATRLAQAGIEPAALQRLMGHAHYDQTLQYIHLSTHTLREAYDTARAVDRRRQEERPCPPL